VISGTVTFHGPYIGHKDCHGVGAFADMAAGTDILVLDGAGTTIGKGDLSVLEGSGDDGCIFGFTSEVPDVPFYTFKIGDRDGPTFSLADMKSQGWKVELTVGK
jgi:hypothetical protein